MINLQKLAFMKMVMCPLCLKWKNLLYNAPKAKISPYPLSLHLIMECRMSLGPVMQGTSILDQICNLTLCKNGLIKSDKMPFSLIRFSLTTNDLGEFLEILEIFQHALQSIFEMHFEIRLVNM